jgi:hypothetical protein
MKNNGAIKLFEKEILFLSSIDSVDAFLKKA